MLAVQHDIFGVFFFKTPFFLKKNGAHVINNAEAINEEWCYGKIALYIRFIVIQQRYFYGILTDYAANVLV